MTMPINAMSVDVEDYFQVQAFAGVVDRKDWDAIPQRVEQSTERVLGAFASAGIRATFFVLGWVADRHPALIRRIVDGGHELASHGYGHELVHMLTAAQFRDDLVRAKDALEAAGGVSIQGYRAPTFSIGPGNPWAYDVLAETGHRYSSSVYPVKHDLYGAPDASRFPHNPGSSHLLEIPMTTLRMGGRNLPISGGGYFRLMPYPLFRNLLRRFHTADQRSAMFYFHPWEVDPDQPRIKAASARSRFRHGVNLHAMLPRMERLLRDFRWGRIDEVFAVELDQLK